MISKNIFNRYLAVALTCLFTSAAVWAATGDVISFNFHQDDSGNKGPLVGDQVTLEGTIPADNWNSNKKNIASGNWQNGSNSTTLVYNVNSNVGSECEATCAWTFTAAHFYGGAAANYSDENYFMKCIAAPQAGGSGTETLTISNIPFAKYYAVLYISNWDIGHNTSFKLGETNYSVSATGLAIPDSTADWGGTATSPVYGTNAVKIDNLSGDFSFSMTAAKCNVCAIQIVDDTAAKAGEEVVWSNLDSDAAKGTHFTKGNNAITLSIPESESCALGAIIAIKSVKFANKSGKTMQNTITINGQVSDTMTTDTSFAGNGDTSYNILHIYNFSTPPLVTIGEDYSIGTPGNNQLAAIQTDSPILIPGLASPWDAGYNAYCAVEGEVYTPAGYRVEQEEVVLALSDSTPVKVFSGINSLSMLKSKFDAGEVSAMIGGEWLDPAKNIEAFVLDTETDTTLSYQFQVDDDNYLKMVVVEFTVGADGIYAKQTAQGNVSGKGAELLGQKVLTSGGDYTFSSVGIARYTITTISAPAVVKAVGDDKVEVEFSPANDEDWADLILPTKAKGVAVAGNMSFASRSAYKQTLGEREATVALVTDAQEGNLIYGLHAFDAAGLGPIDRDIYLMMNGGTAGVLSGGEDATYNATKTVLTGNTLLNLKGDATVDYVYGAGLGGGQNITTTGDIGIVIEDEAQVKGTLAAGWQSRHNSLPKVVGNTTVLIKNVQTYESAATLSSNKSSDQGWILGGGYHWGNYNSACQIEGNSSIVIDIDNEKTGVFAKNIAGGGYAKDNGTGDCKTTRDSSVVISAPDTVTFSKNVLGGGHATGTNKATIGGNSSVTINGGTFTGTIYVAGDNGEHTLVSGTATLTINGGDLLGATIHPGTATGEKILNLNGGKFPINAAAGFTTINIAQDVEFNFAAGTAANMAIPFTGCTALTYGTRTSGQVVIPANDIKVGDLTIRASVTLDLDNKTIKYTVSGGTTLTRRPDADLTGDNKYNWTAPKSWLNGNNEAVDWPAEGATYVNINADQVSKIVVDTKVEADMITLTNTAAEEGAEFRFETLEPLDEVADMTKEDPDYIINGSLSASGFSGALYLQSRIKKPIILGQETRVFFVSMVAGADTTAYPYTFQNRLYPICKIGPGAFVVPNTMYDYPFNVRNGKLVYDIPEGEELTLTAAIVKDEHLETDAVVKIAKRGEGTLIFTGRELVTFLDGIEIEKGVLKLNAPNGDYPFWNTTTPAKVLIKNGGTLDLNGKGGFKADVTAEEGAIWMNSGNSISTGTSQARSLTLTGNAAIVNNKEGSTTENDSGNFGLLANGYGATQLVLGEYTLTKTGPGMFYLCNTTVTGTGTIKIAEGNFHIVNNSTAPDVTIEFLENSDVVNEGGNITVEKLIRHGSVHPINAAVLNHITPAKVELAEGGVIETTGNVTLPYALAESQNGVIKITNPGTDAFKLANVDFAAIPDTLDIVNAADNTSIKGSFYVENGGLFFGNQYTEATYTLSADQLTQLGEMTSGRPYIPDSTLSFTNPNVTIDNLPSDDYLVKNVNGTLMVFKKTNSISIKFGTPEGNAGIIDELDENVGGFPVMGMFWNHSKIYTDTNYRTPTTEIMKVKDGNGNILPDTRVFYYCPNTYWSGNRNTRSTGNGKLTYSYIDDTERVSGANATAALTITQDVDGVSETRTLKPTPTGKLFWEVGISNVPYQVFDLYIIQASDQTGETISLLPIGVKANDGEWKYFAGDGNGSTIAATNQTRWNGAPYCDSETMVEGTNYIRYRMSAAALGLAAGTKIENIYLTYPDRSNGRLGLAGIQIVAVDDDGIYKRKAGAETLWTAANTWTNSNGQNKEWPTSATATAYAQIDADNVTEIKLDSAVKADMVTLYNSVETYVEDAHSFKFLTTEGLDTVNDLTLTDKPILNAPVDATQFCGDLYLQSRISGQVSLGAKTYVNFVADVAGETTTAYPYNFSGTINPIRKRGPGTFIVPSSMYNVGFNITEGAIRFDADGEYSGRVTGGHDAIITASNFKLGAYAAFQGASAAVVKDGATLDMNGLAGGNGAATLTLDGGSYINTVAVSGIATTGDAQHVNKTSPFNVINVTKDSTIGGSETMPLVSQSYGVSTINLGTNTLTKAGNNIFALCNTTINGSGTLDITSGTLATRYNAVTVNSAEIIVRSGATLDIGSNLTVGMLGGDGTLTGTGTLTINGIDLTQGSDCLTVPAGLTVKFGEVLTVKGGVVGGTVIAGLPSNVAKPSLVKIDGQSGNYIPVLNTDGTLTFRKDDDISVAIPTVEHTIFSVSANGTELTVSEDNTVSVMVGTTITITYTPEAGYVGGGSVTVDVFSAETKIDVSSIKVSHGVKVVIREWKGAKVRTIEGLDESGIAAENTIKINGEVYDLTTPIVGKVTIENGVVIIDIKPLK